MKEIINEVLSFAKSTERTPIDIILSEYKCKDKFSALPEDLQSLIEECLILKISKRPTAKQLLQWPIFQACRFNEAKQKKNGFYMFSPQLRCANLELPTNEEFCEDFLSERAINEVCSFIQYCSKT